jgi:hypothetical protein
MKICVILVIGLFFTTSIYAQSKQVKLYPIQPKFEYQEANNFLDSTKFIVDNNYIQFKPLKGNNRFGFDDPKGKKYSGAFNNDKDKVDVIRKKYNNKVEEFIIVRDSTLNNFQYKIKTNCTLVKVGDFIKVVGLGYIDRPIAKDSIGQSVNVTMQLSGDTLTYFWSRNDSFPDIKLPIEIDPTVIIQPVEAGMLDAYWQSDVGAMQNDTELDLCNNDATKRATFLRFPLLDSIPVNATISSVVLTLYNIGNKANSPPTTGYLLCKTTALWTETQGSRPVHDTTNARATMVMDTTQDAYFTISSDSGATTNGIAADSLLNWVQRAVNLADSNYGSTIRFTNENTGTSNILRWASSGNATAAFHPSLTVTYTSGVTTIVTKGIIPKVSSSLIYFSPSKTSAYGIIPKVQKDGITVKVQGY